MSLESPALEQKDGEDWESRPYSRARRWPHGAVTLVRVMDAWPAGDPPSSQAALEISLTERRDKWYQWWMPREELAHGDSGSFLPHHHVYKRKRKSLSRV